MIIIGAATERARGKADDFYRAFPSERIFASLRTAEMAKHALKRLLRDEHQLRQRARDICDAVGADGLRIAQILRKDGRIGPKAQVRPGLGFAGATLRAICGSCKRSGRGKACPRASSTPVLAINGRRVERVVKLVEDYFEGACGARRSRSWGSPTSPDKHAAPLRVP